MTSGINLLPTKDQEDKKKKTKPVVIEMTSPGEFEQHRKKSEGGVLYFIRKVFKRPKPVKSEEAPRKIGAMPKTVIAKSPEVELPKIRFVKEPDQVAHVTPQPELQEDRILSEMRQGRPDVAVPAPQRFGSRQPSGAQERAFRDQQLPSYPRPSGHLPPVPQQVQTKPPEAKEIRYIASTLPDRKKGPGLMERISAWFRRLFSPRPSSKPPEKVPAAPRQTPPPARVENAVPSEFSFVRTAPPAPQVQQPTMPPPPAVVPRKTSTPMPPVPLPPKKAAPAHLAPAISHQRSGPSLWTRLSAWFSRLFSKREKKSVHPPPPQPVMNMAPAPTPPPVPPHTMKTKQSKNSSTQPGMPPPAPPPGAGQQYTTAPDIQRGRMSGVNLVPEDVLQRSRPAPYLKMIGWITLAEIILLVIGYLGVNFWQKSVIGETEVIDNKITLVQQQIASFDDFRKESELLKRHIDDTIYVLDHRIHWTKFLELVEAHTLPSIYYSSLTADTSGHVTVNAVSSSLIDVSRQLTLLENSPDFAKQVSITSIVPEADGEGNISYLFVASFVIPESLFYRTQ